MRLDHLLSKEKSRGCIAVELSRDSSASSGADAIRGNTRSHPEHDG